MFVLLTDDAEEPENGVYEDEDLSDTRVAQDVKWGAAHRHVHVAIVPVSRLRRCHPLVPGLSLTLANHPAARLRSVAKQRYADVPIDRFHSVFVVVDVVVVVGSFFCLFFSPSFLQIIGFPQPGTSTTVQSTSCTVLFIAITDCLANLLFLW